LDDDDDSHDEEEDKDDGMDADDLDNSYKNNSNSDQVKALSSSFIILTGLNFASFLEGTDKYLKT
jgi:hypothetical protein